MSSGSNSRSVELAAMVGVVGGHVEVAVAAEVEEDHPLLAGLLRRLGLVDRGADRVRRLGRRQDALDAGELDGRREGARLRDRGRLDDARLDERADAAASRRGSEARRSGAPAARSRGRACTSASAGSSRPCRRSRSGTHRGSGSGRRPARRRGSASRHRPAGARRRNGKATPAKFEPPPTQPITTSGYSPASSSWSRHSWPITV